MTHEVNEPNEVNPWTHPALLGFGRGQAQKARASRHVCARIFALSTHVSFIMTFVDPSGDSFSTEPTYATEPCLVL